MKNIISTWDGITEPRGQTYDIAMPPTVFDPVTETYTPPVSGSWIPQMVDDYITSDDVIDQNAIAERIWDGNSAYLTSKSGDFSQVPFKYGGWPESVTPVE